MAEQLSKVQPGDLITAQFINGVIDEINFLADRVAALEGSGPGIGPIITGLSPQGDIHMGDELRILGRNFGVTSLAVVTIDGNRIDQIKAGSGDQLLIIDVTGILNLPSDNMVTLVVSNNKGTDSRQFRLLPGQATVLTGQLTVDLPAPPPEALTAGDHIFQFPLHAQTSMAAGYTIEPKVTPVGSATGWKVDVVDGGGNPSPKDIQIPQSPPGAATDLNFRVKLTIPAGVAAGSDFQLALKLTSNTTPPLSGSRFVNLKTGNVVPPPQTKIKVTLGNVFPPGAKVNGEPLIPPTNTDIPIHFPVEAQDAGVYNILAPTLVDPTGRYTVKLKNSPASFQTFTQNDNTTGKVIVTLAATAGGAADATLIVKVAKASDATIVGEISQPIHIKLS
jgi:hypothetical protein